MKLPEEGCLVRIFIGERDRHGHKPLYEWIVIKAREFRGRRCHRSEGEDGIRRKKPYQNKQDSKANILFYRSGGQPSA